MRIITLKRDGYDSFIDFLKGFCIVSVVLTHSLPENLKDKIFFCAWGGMAVPLFFLIQIFHSYKSGFGAVSQNFIAKILRRIVFPFLLTLLIICLVKVLANPNSLMFIVFDILCGGGGPGSYYPWIYVELALVLFVLRPLLRKMNFEKMIVFFSLCAIAFELLCSFINVSPGIYRVLFFRGIINMCGSI